MWHLSSLCQYILWLWNSWYMLYLCSYGWASPGMRHLGVAVWVRQCCAHFDCNVCAHAWTIPEWLCVPRGAACLAECRRVSHHVCGVWVWLWVSELVGSCESLGVGCVVCPCVLGSVSSHAVCVRVSQGVWVWLSVVCITQYRPLCVTIVCQCVSSLLCLKTHPSPSLV